MSTQTIEGYTAALTIDASADYFLMYQNSSNSYKKINRNTILGTSGTPVDTTSVQTLQNKVLDNTNTITLKDTLFTLQDDSDVTKQAKFQLSGITTGTTRTYTLPNASSTLADIATVQTFTNKTLTSPVITGGTIDNTTITVDSISGHTTANSGTIYGVAITSSKIPGTSLTNASITTTQIATNGVGASNLATNAITLGSAQITTNFTTTATPAYTDVTSLTVTVTVPAGSRDIEIVAFAGGIKTSAAAGTVLSWSILEGSTVLNSLIINEPVTGYNCPALLVVRVSAPSPGSHTYKVAVSQSAAGTLTVGAGTANPTVTNFGPAVIYVKAI